MLYEGEIKWGEGLITTKCSKVFEFRRKKLEKTSVRSNVSGMGMHYH